MSEPRLVSSHRTRAVEDCDRDLAVTAGAGAGKTTVLVDRYLRLARDPDVGPGRILAITFTRKAAGEMKERVIRQLEKAGETDLRRKTEAAIISTIHGFCERVLREHPFEAGIDPRFTVLSEYDEALFVEEAVQAMYGRKDLRSYAIRLKKSFKGGWQIFGLVRTVAKSLREGSKAARAEADAIVDEAMVLALARARAEEYVRAADSRVLECMKKVHPLLEAAPFKSKGVMYSESREYLQALRDCLKAKSAQAASIEVLSKIRFTGQFSDDDTRQAIRPTLEAIKADAPIATFSNWDSEERLERELFPLKRAIYSAATEIGRSYEAHKKQIGSLDFHDLQQITAKLLETDARVRCGYADHFRHILLDESQDTDELQYQILELLRTPHTRLFVVGDPKQAIYEFRGANPDVFHRAVERLPEGDQLQLAENFRSRPEVVAFVNSFGGKLLPGQFITINGQANYEGCDLDGPTVTTLLAIQQEIPGEDKKHESVSDVRPREAAAVADEIVRLLQEQPLVRDPDSREVSWVPLRPRHIAFLFRSRTAVPYFERALADRGVPYVTSAGQGFYERAEVLDCLMMLRVLSQPLDDLAMAAVLRSPFIAASDADLWSLRALGREGRNGDSRPLFDALAKHDGLAGFRRRFTELRRKVRGRTASVALDAAIMELGYEPALAAADDGPAMLANLAKVRHQVRDMGALSPAEAYDELERRRGLMVREEVAPLVGPADDVVVLTTIHGAKGLEWPVVCIPNAQSTGSNEGPQFSPRHGVLLCKAMDDDEDLVHTLSVKPIIEDLAKREEAEERRLLYVALTRARERLIISASVKPALPERKSKNKYTDPLSFLRDATGDAIGEDGEREHAGVRITVRSIHSLPDERRRYQSGETLASEISPRIVNFVPADVVLPRALPISLKATELLAFRKCPQIYRFSHVMEIEENLRRRAAIRGEEAKTSAVEVGNMVHMMLERARFEASDTGAEIARLVEGCEATLHDRLRTMVAPVLEGEVGTAIRGASRIEREWPFVLSLGGVPVEGVIDLAIQGPDDKWIVVDYKSNDISRTGRIEQLTDYYAPQLELYALALSRAGVGKVSECVLVFLNGPTVKRWAFQPDSGDLESWVTETIERITAADYATTVGPKCERCGYRKRSICDTGRAWTPSVAPPGHQPPSSIAIVE